MSKVHSGEGKIYPAGEEGWVARWEDREQEFRKIVSESKKEIEERYKNQLAKLSKDLSNKQRVILTIRDIPYIGKLIVTWAEGKVYTDGTKPDHLKLWPEPSDERTVGSRG